MVKLVSKTTDDLQTYYKLKTKSIPNLENKIECLETQIIGVGAIEYSDMPKGKGPNVSYKKEKLIDEKSRTLKQLEESKSFVEYMEKALSKLNNVDKGLLIECYAKDKYERQTEYVICKDLNISSATFYRRKREVIKEFTVDLNGIEAL